MTRSRCTDKHKPFTPAEKEQMKLLRKERGLTYREIGDMFGTGPQCAYSIVNDIKRGNWKRSKKKPAEFAHETIVVPMPRFDTRSLTGVLLGDPLPERSALARKRQEARA